jgi:CTP:molybdopterin cytidylyltransferase MocA
MSKPWSHVKEKLDAVVLAGDRDAYKPVCGDNKALLEIAGRPVLGHVVAALQKCRYVSRIFVVGPKERIREALERAGEVERWDKEVIAVDQWGTLLENGWNTFLATLSSPKQDSGSQSEERLRALYGEKVVLFLGADMPLLTAYELEEFIEVCDMDRHDYILGMTSEEYLKPYYPSQGMPGMRLAYFHFRDSRERQNNLHMIRVFRVINRHYAQLMYRFRYQKRWQNILLILWELLRTPELRPGMILRFCLLHVCRMLGRIPWFPLNRLLRRPLDKRRLEKDIGLLLRTRFGMGMTTYGGATLDIDNTEQFAVIERQFDRWRSLQEKLYRERTESLKVAPSGADAQGHLG